MSITYSKVSGIDIKRVVDKIHNALNDEENTHVMMACLVIAIGMQKPDISLEKMIEGVKGASEWISAFVSDPDIPTDLSMN